MADQPQGGATELGSRRDRRSRRETLEAMRRQQRAKERRKTLMFVALATVIGLALISVAAVPAVLSAINDPKRQAPASFGVAAAAAGCDPEVVDPVEGVQDHVAEGERVDYRFSPPSSGRHDGAFVLGARPFYETSDRPAVEKLVHSLEHGHLVVWYDETVQGEQLEALRGLAERMRTEPATRGKVIVAPWTGAAENRAPFPEGKHVAMTRWGAQQAWRQYCGSVSGEAVNAFATAHPSLDAPEPNGI